MPKYAVRVTQTVSYDVEIKAATKEEATQKVQAQIDEGDGEDMDLTEVDSSEMEIDTDYFPRLVS